MRRPSPLTIRPWRHSLSIPCQLVREDSFSLVGDCILDLSETGGLIGPVDPLLTGEDLLLSFELPIVREYLDLDVRVTRVMHGRRPGESLRAAGIEFLNISRYQMALLHLTLQAFPVAPPRWRPGRRVRQSVVRQLLRGSVAPVHV